MHEVEVWLLCDESGNYVCCEDASDLAERYAEQVDGGSELGRRVLKLTVKVPVPEFTEVRGEAPAEEEPTLTVSEG
jgi:hypothetical protein